MNKYIKLIAVTILTFSSTVILANEKSTILMSETKEGYTIDFLNSDDVTGLQFDITMSGVNLKNTSLDSCVKGLPSTHTGVCNVASNGSLRVIVFSTTNAILDSGSIGTIQVPNFAHKVVINNLIMGTPDLKEIKGEAVIDVNLKGLDIGNGKKLK